MSKARTLANFGGTDLATQAELDAAEFDDDIIQTNLALLAFKTAVNGSLAKYNLQDQIVDAYAHASDTSGIDGTPSTNHVLAGGAYSSAITTGEGGTIIESGSYTGDFHSHTFYFAGNGNSTNNFVVIATTVVDYLIIGGGGSGGNNGGGGGAGGFRAVASVSLSAGTYAIVAGAGGAGALYSGATGQGNNGISSSITQTVGSGFSTVTITGGGKGGSGSVGGTTTDGSGGGGGYELAGGAAGTYGTAGSASSSAGTPYGGGGGAGQAGGVNGTGYGGDGSANLYRTGVNETRAGGGGGGIQASSGQHGLGGSGGGGAGSTAASFDGGTGVDGTDNTGSGGGGAAGGSGTSGSGGNGIVVIRYLPIVSDLTLQSTDTEAEAQPTKADMVMLVEDAGSGVGTVNTHIKGHISRDSGTTFTEGVLVDEGDWGADKRILAFHDLDIDSASQPDGVQMCYKITTHSQSSVYNTKIHATSIGWK